MKMKTTHRLIALLCHGPILLVAVAVSAAGAVITAPFRMVGRFMKRRGDHII